MANLLNPKDRQSLEARIDQLTPEHQRHWGTLSVDKMVCHLADQLRVALGETPSKPQGSFLSHTLIKWLVLYGPIPTPKGKIQTAPEMLRADPGAWEADIATLHQLIERFMDSKEVALHPFFGSLRHHQWGILAAKHLDHHLKQFGV